ncbi:DotG/IcmE/VirB10 family type IV secretion system protein [Acinetobacter gandensis]|uniref:DotG/IcmE/VirB10 family protein n=1 Tax=Acinetobacter gandensis TaxID=1443941 RepID=UPI003989A279
MDLNNHNNPLENDIADKRSQSTEVGHDNENVISANQSVNESESTKLKNVSIDKVNKKRLLSDTRFRVFAVGGGVIGFGVLLFLFNPFGKSEQLNVDGSVSVATPEIQGQGTNTIPAEYVEYERQKQAQLAAQAGQNGESYLPEFKTVATDPNSELSDQNFLTGPNGQPVNQNGTGQNGGNITLELDQMARANMANSTQQNGTLPQPTQGGLQQNSNQPNTPIYQSSYTQQYETAQNASADINGIYSQQASQYAERNAAVRELSQTAFVDQLGAYSSKKNEKTGYSAVNYSAKSINTNNASGQSNLSNLDTANSSVAISQKGPAIIKAGTSMKARLDTGVNTDKGKNLFATVIGGKFNGAKLLGTVGQNTADIEFNFNRMLFKGEEYAINVRALTLGTKQSGMADKVQKHTMQRLGGLVTAGIFEGYGQAYQNIGTTQITNGGNVISTKQEPNDKEIAGNIIGNVGTEMANVARSNTNRQPTYIVNAGKVFEVFFDTDVTSPKK